MKLFRGSSWIIKLPLDWKVSDKVQDIQGFCDSDKTAQLQVESKIYDLAVNFNDISDEVNDVIMEKSGTRLRPDLVRYPYYSGLNINFSDKNYENYWKLWWLIKGNKMLYVAFSTGMANRDSTIIQTAEEIVSSIKPID